VKPCRTLAICLRRRRSRRLQQIITRRGDGRWYVRSLELRGEGQLKLVKATTGNFTQTVWVPLAELDTFLYADIFKGQEPWGIEVFCAHRVDCLRLESVNDGELTRRADNNDSWFLRPIVPPMPDRRWGCLTVC
jgi:hypothetical protein